MKPCEVWQQRQQDQWVRVEDILCGLFPSGDSGKMFFPSPPGRCPVPQNRIKEPGKGGGVTWWEVTDIEAKIAETVQVTVRRCPPPPG